MSGQYVRQWMGLRPDAAALEAQVEPNTSDAVLILLLR